MHVCKHMFIPISQYGLPPTTAGTIRRVGGLTISSTIITSTLANVATESTNILFALYDQARGRDPALNITEALYRTGTLFGVWALYLVGGIFAQLAFRRIGM